MPPIRPFFRNQANRSLLDHALAVAVVALLMIGLSGEVRGALAGLIEQVDGARTALLAR
jgi:Flp pilus assembly pilin Flp